MKRNTLREVLETKGNKVFTIDVKSTVADAVQEMLEKAVGSVLVMQEGRVVGIFTERDVARRVAFRGLDPRSTPIAEVMTRHLAFIEPDTSVQTAIKIMSETHCRHLPVIHDGAPVGVVSLGDLIRLETEELEAQITFLESYISRY
jgi:CBS domain-containing protein